MLLRDNAAKRAALCGLLTALMLVLGYIESLLPVGGAIPGVKLGLANSVLIYAVWLLPAPIAVLLMLCKVLLSALLFGSPFALWFSLAGGALSLASMLLCKRLGFGVLAVGVIGAVLHNIAQVLVAMLALRTPGLWCYMAVLSLVGAGTGLLTGTVAAAVMRALERART